MGAEQMKKLADKLEAAAHLGLIDEATIEYLEFEDVKAIIHALRSQPTHTGSCPTCGAIGTGAD